MNNLQKLNRRPDKLSLSLVGFSSCNCGSCICPPEPTGREAAMVAAFAAQGSVQVQVNWRRELD